MQPYIKFFAFYSKENLIQVRVVDFNDIARKARIQAAKQGRKLPPRALTAPQKTALSMKKMFEGHIEKIRRRPAPNPQAAAKKKDDLEDVLKQYEDYKREFKEYIPVDEKDEEVERLLKENSPSPDAGALTAKSDDAPTDIDDEDEGEDKDDKKGGSLLDTLESGIDYEQLYKMGDQMQLAQISMVTCVDFERDTKQLHQLAKQNKIAQMKIRLQAGSNVNEINDLKRTPIDYAIASGHLDSVKFLVENGAEMDFKGRHGAALHYAAGVGDAKIFNYLLNEAKASPEVRDEDGDIPLHYACAAGNIDFVKDLMLKGDVVDVVNHRGNTPLHYACAFGQTEIVELLLQLKASPNMKNKEGWTCFHMLTARERVNKCARTVRDTDATQTRSANRPRRSFPDTSCENYSKIIRLLKQHGGDINAVNDKNQSPLAVSVEAEEADMVSMWLAEGANPNMHRKSSPNLLADALKDNFVSVAINLIDHNVNVKEATSYGRDSVLFSAVRTGAPNLISKMIDAGIDVNPRNTDQQTPLHLVSASNYLKDLQELKTKYKKGQLHPEAFGPTSFDYLGTAHTLIENGAFLEARDKNNLTPLLQAAIVGDYEMIELLLVHGADIDAQAKDGSNALHLVCKVAEEHNDPPMVPSEHEMPQKYGKKIKLMMSQQPKGVLRFLRSAQILIKYDVHINQTDSIGRAPLFVANKSKHKDLVHFLEEKGAKDHATRLYNIMKKDLEKLEKTYGKDGKKIVSKANDSAEVQAST